MKISAIHYKADGTFTSQSNITSSSDIDVLFGSVMSVIIFSSSTLNELATASNIQIEHGTTATTYEPYDPNHTVYGGWVDLITGEVQEEWIYAECNDKTLWEEMTNNTCDFYYTHSFTGRKRFDTSYQGLVSSSFLIDNTKNVYMRWVGTGSDKVGIRNRTTSYTLTDIQQMAENGDISICYKLATPNTYHLAPTQLQTFLGQNNVWSNADYVEIEYDLHETQDILARKQFIIANQPHLEEASGSIATFNTDMKAPLKECKVYFSPVQDLHGYSNPWPAGGGRNIFHVTAQSQTSETGVVFTVNSDGSVKAVGNPSISTSLDLGTITLPAGTYKIQGGISSAAYLNIPSKVNSYGGAASFTIAEGGETITPRIYITANKEVNGTFYPMIKVDSDNDATWEPYENICPIEGWSGIETVRCGKNLFDLNESDMVIDGWNRFFPNPMKIPGKYTISCEQQFGGNSTKGSAIFFVNYADNSAEHIGRGAIGYSFGLTVFSGNTTVTEEQANASYILFGMSSSGCTFESLENAKIQIEFGSTATEYEPYAGTTIPITFPATKNLFDEKYEGITSSLVYYPLYVGEGDVVASTTTPQYTSPSDASIKYSNIFVFPGQVTTGASTGMNDICVGRTRTITPVDGYITIAYRNGYDVDPRNYHTQIEVGSTATAYEPYGTIYGGYVDLVSGEVVQEYELVADTWSNIKYSSVNSTTGYQYGRLFFNNPVIKAGTPESKNVSYCNVGTYTWNLTNNATPHFYIDIVGSTERYAAYITLPSTTDDNLLIICVGKLINPIVYPLNSQTLKTLRGTNNIWSNTNGNIELAYWSH